MNKIKVIFFILSIAIINGICLARLPLLEDIVNEALTKKEPKPVTSTDVANAGIQGVLTPFITPFVTVFGGFQALLEDKIAHFRPSEKAAFVLGQLSVSLPALILSYQSFKHNSLAAKAMGAQLGTIGTLGAISAVSDVGHSLIDSAK